MPRLHLALSMCAEVILKVLHCRNLRCGICGSFRTKRADKKKPPVEMRIWVKRKPKRLGRAITEDWRSDYSDFGTIEGKLDTI